MSNDNTDKAEFDYDTAGNITAKAVYVNGVEQLDESTISGYRKDNLLDSVTVGDDNGAVAYTYDILGRRIAMMVDTVPYQFDYDGESLLVERGGADLKRSYLYGLGLIWEKDHTQQGAPVAYHYADAHGSTRMLCDADGDPIAYTNYDAWGNALDGSDAVGRFSYAGEWGYKSDSSGYGDAVTGGIMQCGVRFYDPDIGRFLQMDPLLGSDHAPGSLNRYVYCRDDPTDAVDPLGLVRSAYVIGGGCAIALIALILLDAANNWQMYCALRDWLRGSISEDLDEQRHPIPGEEINPDDPDAHIWDPRNDPFNKGR